MGTVNTRRLWLSTLAGGIVWTIWTMIVNIAMLGNLYALAQEEGMLQPQPRYSSFLGVWILTLFLLTFLGTWLYASVRSHQGAGAKTALKIGVLLGFAAGFPMNLTIASWMPIDRVYPFWWMVDLGVGAILAIMTAAWLYRE